MNQNQIQLSLVALLHFDGTTMTIQIQSLRDPAGTSLNDTTGTAARIFEFFRAKGIETQDYRVIDQPRPQVIPYDAPPVTARLAHAPLAGPHPRPLYPEPIESHHVTHADPSPAKPSAPREEISL